MIFETDLGVVILEQLQKNSTLQMRKFYEDRLIFKL